MGKQWLLSKLPPTDSAGKSSSTNKKPTGKPRKRGSDRQTSSSSSFGGCMTAIFHLFDHFHHLPFHPPSLISESSLKILHQEPNITLKGVEAPRNSLEIEEQEPMVEEIASSSASSSSSSFKLKQDINFNIPKMREIQINTKRSRLMEDISSECGSSSPGTKTPTLVARLMGLDLLPEYSSPRGSLSSPRGSSSSSHPTPLNPLSKLSSNKLYNARSLPATPRVSTAPRSSTEGDYHHRFSLQINKENKRRYDESTSEYAKQIAKQVRENISRRVGADITNKKEHRRDEYLVVLKPNKPSPPSTTAATIDNRSRNLNQGPRVGKENYEPTTLSCAARIRLWEIKNNLNKSNSSSLKSSPLSSTSEVVKTPSSSTTTTKSPLPLIKDEVQVVKAVKIQKCKKITNEKYDLRLKKMPQQEEPFLKKCNKKSTPLSNHLVKVNTSTKFISFKKDMTYSSSTTLPQNQVPLASITHLPSCQSWSYNNKKSHNLPLQEKFTGTDTGTGNGTGIATITTTTARNSISDYFDYISTILNHSGIEKTTQITISHWYSPSHPLHPSIFHQIEKHQNTTATRPTDRKLIFDVVDELLVDILKPYISFKPWAQSGSLNWAQMGPWNTHQKMCGHELCKLLCDKIRYFPAADCQVLEDIDELIDMDMRRATRVVGTTAFEEVAEELVAEMERDMVDTLVCEMASMILHVGCGNSV